METGEFETYDETYDVVGVGFGPSNLALAIALEESQAGIPITAAFFERQPAIGWHKGMLLPAAKMQVAFLKDLVTFRNPTSRFSFVAFLHATGRLARFINNQDFFATRHEFHSYLEWAASGVADRVSYGSEITAIRIPAKARERGEIDYVQVEVQANGSVDRPSLIKARNVVISTGLVPRMPDGVERDDRVWHSSEFLHRFRLCDSATLRRVAVVGAGQSGAEVVRYLHDALPGAQVAAILPSYGYAIADNTPFANQVFDPSAVDDYFYGSELSKEEIWRYHKNTNYSVVDSDLLKDLYQRLYEDDLRGKKTVEFLNLTRISSVERLADGLRVTVNSVMTGRSFSFDVDVLVCATGYHPTQPSKVLGELADYCLRDEGGRYRVERDYRLVTVPSVRCGIYLQGGTEHTHGLSSSLLSNIALRCGEIADSIVAARKATAPSDLARIGQHAVTSDVAGR
jgi:L-ornithine N5-oxygenase